MTDDIRKQQDEVNRKIDNAYNRLEELKDNDEGVVEELEKLDSKRQRYTVLSELNDRLEKLERLGGADLFWGENHDQDSARQQQKRVHDLVINYDSRVAELESKQQLREEAVASLTAKINILNEDTVALQELEEELAEEFIIEREMVEVPFHPMAMPWNKDDEDQKKFRKILLIILFSTVLLGVLIPMWDIPIPDRVEVVEIPERLAKLMMKKKAPPPPPPKAEKKEEKEPEKEKAKKKDKKPVPEKAKKARKKAESAGLMAFKDDFADLIDDTPVAKLGAKAKISGKGSKAKKTTRSLVTSSVGSGSAGINTASLSRNVGGTGDSIGGVEFSRVESSIGTDFDGEESPLSAGPGPSRTDEEIQIVFDRYKSALYRIYNRQLRKNPTLQGKMVLRITIRPDGSVSASAIDSSDMDSPELDKKISARVKKFNFGAKEGVSTITILYPIDFLPAS
ncbi:MAG: AgmX/PglI C-terminal domain-containing protein [Gammaproteobacteria bacterium]|nr:AgmX/PglI C-terminal domain-containing protein [Gammaproteobacteria bacterium]